MAVVGRLCLGSRNCGVLGLKVVGGLDIGGCYQRDLLRLGFRLCDRLRFRLWQQAAMGQQGARQFAQLVSAAIAGSRVAWRIVPLGQSGQLT